MNWDYIAGFFDGEGNLHMNILRSKNKEIQSLQLICRIYNVNRDILIKIRNFIGYGKIYFHKNHRALELVIMGKDNVKSFLKNIKNRLYLKKDHVDYVLNNFNFNKDNNKNFDLEKFRIFVDRVGVEKLRKKLNR